MHTIVVIEDQPVLASAYRNKVKGEGFNVEVALDGELGLDLLIVYSTAALFSEQQAGLKAGVVAYLVKPEDLLNWDRLSPTC